MKFYSGLSCIQCTFAMFTSTLKCHLSTHSIFSKQPILEKSCVRSVCQIPKLFQKPVKKHSMKGICENGNLKEAFQSLTHIFANQTSFDICLEEIYSPVLELCAHTNALSPGQQIHAHLIKYCSLCDSVFLSTKLIYMYGKCGFPRDAEKVFIRMYDRTIFTWNAMIGTHVSNEEYSRALALFEEMHALGVAVDACTFPCVLKACSALHNHCFGSQVHVMSIKCGYVSIVFVANALVSMYAKCNDLQGARLSFDSIIEKDNAVSWNSIIMSYSANGQSLEALSLFRKMLGMGLASSTYSFVSALQACDHPSLRKQGMEIHAAILKSNDNLDIYVANALVAMYAKCGQMEHAARIFETMDYRDSVTWNTMLSGFVQNDLYYDALIYFQDMWNSSQKPDKVAVLNLISASGRSGSILNGMELHAYAIKNGFDLDLHIGNTLIDMYSKCGCLKFMGCTFEKMPYKDLISWTTIMAGYAQNECHATAVQLFRKVIMEGMKIDTVMAGSILLACSSLKCESFIKEIHGHLTRTGLSDILLENTIVDAYGKCRNVDYARKMFELIESRDIVSWTSMISCCVHNCFSHEALKIFRCLIETNIDLDHIALVSALSAAASLSALTKGKEIHGFLIRKGFLLEGPIVSSLVDLYARCGILENSNKIFNSTQSKDPVLWTSMIDAYGMHGHGKVAIDLFNKMRLANVVPDHITFLALLYACSHSGLTIEGKKFLEIMKHDYQLEPWPEHYACLVDLLGRANCLEEAYRFVESMKDEPTSEVWCALLGACRIHSNKELGEIAAKKLLQLGSENPGNFVLISNVFAENGRWKDVREVRMRMKDSGLRKIPGCSWTEIGNRIHTFVARDKSHPQSNHIYQKLAEITEALENEGYVAQTKYVLHNVEEKEKIDMLYGHSERLAIAYALLCTPEGTTIRITKNLRICGDCHTFCKLVSKCCRRALIVRDASRFHHFERGVCSCRDFW